MTYTQGRHYKCQTRVCQV